MAYSDLVIWQYRTKPKAIATLQAVESVFATAMEELLQLRSVLDIENANGHQLDIIGKHIGVSRAIKAAILKKFFGFQGSEQALAFNVGQWYRRRSPMGNDVLLDDDSFRFLIKCQILKNYQTATIYDLVNALRFCFGSGCSVADNVNGTVTISVPPKLLTEFKQFALHKLDILPRPAGVKYLFA